MGKRGWVAEALRRGELKITKDYVCPYCNLDVEAHINAHAKHKWVSKAWYEAMKERFR